MVWKFPCGQVPIQGSGAYFNNYLPKVVHFTIYCCYFLNTLVDNCKTAIKKRDIPCTTHAGICLIRNGLVGLRWNDRRREGGGSYEVFVLDDSLGGSVSQRKGA